MTPTNVKGVTRLSNGDQEVIQSMKGLPPLLISNNSVLSKSRDRIKKKKEKKQKPMTKGQREWKEQGFTFDKYKEEKAREKMSKEDKEHQKQLDKMKDLRDKLQKDREEAERLQEKLRTGVDEGEPYRES